tara:strand:- start:889 stop:1749 length:861 start_codon:yes stop_codon:yes gene_type:complete
MINLYYCESYWNYSATTTGPQKVIENLIASLQQEKIVYSVNQEKYKHNFLVQYNHVGHEKHSKIETDTCIIGPQVWLFDDYGKFLIEHQQYFRKIIAPSQWVKDKFEDKFNLPSDKVAVWPVGIQSFNNVRNIEFDCLIYHKSRTLNELNQVKNFLEEKNLSYHLLKYGSYDEQQFRDLANRAKFAFIIDDTESQGIAIQEMMSLGVPLFVWDVKEWTYMGEKYTVPATSVPYWDERCGEKFYTIQEMGETFDKFYARINDYDPKAYVKENLSFESSVKTLLDILK